MMTLEQFDQLRRPQGDRLLAEIRERDPRSATLLAVSTLLRKRFDPDLVAAALSLHELRVRAASKFSRAGRMWFTRSGLEQATAEPIARYRATRFSACRTMADLCCGIGGDLIALADPHGRLDSATILAVDRDPLHLAMALANADVYDIPATITPRACDVRDLDLAGCDGVFIDPARRTDRRRTATGQSEPPLAWCVDLADHIPAVAIKAAPGISRELAPSGWAIEMIAIGTELKEAVLWSPAIASAATSATILHDGAIHHLEPVEGNPVPLRLPEPGDALLDPNPAITRAGLVADLARSIGASMIDERIAFLVAGEANPTPFARVLRVVDSIPWNEKVLRSRLRVLDAGPIDIRRRGLAGDVDAITKRLRGTGARPFTIAMTRVRDRPWAVICEVITP